MLTLSYLALAASLTAAAPSPAEAPAGEAAASAASAPLKVLVLDFAAEDADRPVAKTIGEMVAVSLSRRSYLDVLTGADVRSIAQMEGDRAALGCEGDSSCLAELAGAMGARLVVHGNVGRLGDLYVVTLNVFNAESARAGARTQLEARDLAALAPRVEDAVRELLRDSVSPEVRGDAEEEEVAVEEASPSPLLSPLFLAGAGVAALGVGTAVVGGTLALVNNATLGSDAATGQEKAGARPWGQGGLVVGALGGVVVIGGAALMGVAFVVE